MIEEKRVMKLCKKKLPLQRNSKAFVMDVACRNGRNNVMLGIESSLNGYEINYDVAFLAMRISTNGLLIDCIESKQ